VLGPLLLWIGASYKEKSNIWKRGSVKRIVVTDLRYAGGCR